MATATHKAKSGKKTRKYGRNKAKCAKYLAMGMRAKNKVRRIARHLKRQQGDRKALSRMQHWQTVR